MTRKTAPPTDAPAMTPIGGDGAFGCGVPDPFGAKMSCNLGSLQSTDDAEPLIQSVSIQG